MHRRARHLNPGSAGAVLALDSRFITGLSDGDPVSTWTDRSGNGNDATGSGTARPTLETNEQGGQPALQFNGATNYLDLTTPFYSGSAWTVIEVRINSGGDMVGLSDYGYGPPVLLNYRDNNLYISNQIGYRFVSGQDLTWSILSAINNSDVLSGNRNGNQLSLSSLVSFPLFTNWDCIGANLVGVNTRMANGKIGMIIACNSITPTLRRRLEHAAAFAFKIPCS